MSLKCAITSISLNRTHIWAIIYWNAFAFCLWDLPTVSTDTEIKLTHENVERVGEVRWSAGSYVPWIFPLRILRLLLHILAIDLLILGLATRDFSAVFPFTFFFFFFFFAQDSSIYFAIFSLLIFNKPASGAHCGISATTSSCHPAKSSAYPGFINCPKCLSPLLWRRVLFLGISTASWLSVYSICFSGFGYQAIFTHFLMIIFVIFKFSLEEIQFWTYGWTVITSEDGFWIFNSIWDWDWDVARKTCLVILIKNLFTLL